MGWGGVGGGGGGGGGLCWVGVAIYLLYTELYHINKQLNLY